MSPDYTLKQRASSQNSLSNSRIPKFSPPTSTSRIASPVRKPLHDRSNSQTNSFTGPTIRIVQDPGSQVYEKFPIPTEPSHVLPPPRHAPGYGFEKPASRVSGASSVANTIAKFEAGKSPVAALPLHRKKGFRSSVSTSTSDADTLVNSTFTPSSLRFSQGSTPPSSPGLNVNDFEKGLDALAEEHIHPTQRPTIRAVPPSSSGGDSLESRTSALKPQEPGTHSASTAPATLPPISTDNRNSIDFDESTLIEHTRNTSTGSEKYPATTNPIHPALRTQPSTDSFAFSEISYTSIEPTHYTFPSSQPSPTLHEARTATAATGTQIAYPVVRAPSNSSLRAVSQNYPSVASRMQDQSLVHQWSSQLSTIASVSERDSRSYARGSRSFSRSLSQDSYTGPSNGRSNIPRRRGQTVGSVHSSEHASSDASEGRTEFSAVPLPLFSPLSHDSIEERDHHEERMDTISPLPTHVPLRMKNSGYLRWQSDAASSTESRPGSAQSDISTFIHSTIPAWARVYYRRGERTSLGAPGSESTDSLRLPTSHSGRTQTPSEGNFPLSIYRPRNRPRHRTSQGDEMYLTDDAQSGTGSIYVLGPDYHPTSGYSTPHLRTDRRTGIRYSVWAPPSLDADVNTTLFGRQNRQILLFCVGFIFPLAWPIASFLPLPMDPALANAQSQTDLEQRFARNVGAIDDKAFQKAHWWRNVNRVMTGVGTLLIGVIIALAILASRMG